MLTPENIEAFVTFLADTLPEVIGAVRTIGGGFLTGLSKGLSPLLDSLKDSDPSDFVASMGALGEALGHIAGLSVSVLAFLGGIAAVAVVGLSGALGFIQWFIKDLTSAPKQLSTFGSMMVTAVNNIVPQMVTAGGQIVDGLAAGIRGRATAASDAVTGLATGAVDTVRETLGIQSPSRVFEELGGHTAQGFEDGITGGAAGVDGAVRAMVAAPGAAGSAGGAAGRAGVFQVFIDGAGREASAIVDEMEARMGFSFDRLALSGGDV